MKILEICSKCKKGDKLDTINTFGLRACNRCKEDEFGKPYDRRQMEK